jgi:AIPR protein.
MTLQDFSVVKAYLEKKKEENELDKLSDAFYYMALEQILDIEDEEIFDAITDSSFLNVQKGVGGHDRGIDAIFIENKKVPVIHLFNCKYTDKFSKAKDSNFPSGEIDKIAQYLEMVMAQEVQAINASNDILKQKTEDIWSVFEEVSPTFILHLCANYDRGLQEDEDNRLKKILSKYSNFTYQFHGISSFVRGINGKEKTVINGKFRIPANLMFEKSDGDIRALILSVNGLELLRLMLADENIRNQLDLDDNNLMFMQSLCEDTFYDNVRIYQTQKSRINKSIVKTVLSREERARFFYYNNGITITCKSFSYPKGPTMPIVTLEDIQVVNGSQTMHALFEVMRLDEHNVESLREIELLCRIYELKNPQYSSRIAEYTNSQNPVTTRDIRSIDLVQQNLESEFKYKGYFYERKKDQYKDEPKKKRLDAGKVGQVLMAFYNEMPAEAKNDKKLIFGEKYDDIFNDSINADKVLVAYKLYEKIEGAKKEFVRNRDTLTSKERECKSYLGYVSFYILYTLGVLASANGIAFAVENIEKIFDLYSIALALIEKAIKQERKYVESYNHGAFFKGSRPKVYILDFVRRCGKELTIQRIEKLRLNEINK